MKSNEITALRAELEQLQTPQLEDMLLEELRKDSPDGEHIRLISAVLKERDGIPQINDGVRQAWERYRQKTAGKKPKMTGSFLVKAASVVLVLALAAALLTPAAKAKSFFERLADWTEDVFALINPTEATEYRGDDGFCTVHPGLRQLYEEVTALGITTPVVPTWLPEGYELKSCAIKKAPSNTLVSATFFNGDVELVYQLNMYADNVTSQYYKEGTVLRVEERNGINHTLIRNNDVLVAVWTVDNLECAIAIDCPEDILIKILRSIYTMEER